MSKKTPKKRNKSYQGADASSSQPTIRRYTAVQRSPLAEWWHSKRRVAKIFSIALFVVLFLILVITELFSLLSNGV